jgi:hypothetical protein
VCAPTSDEQRSASELLQLLVEFVIIVHLYAAPNAADLAECEVMICSPQKLRVEATDEAWLGI